MSLWKIAWRSIQQRSLASTLTAVSMALGVMLVVAVMVVGHVVENYFKTGAGLGYNLVVGKKGGEYQLVLNTVYYLGRPIENIPWSYYQEFLPAAKRSDGKQGKFAPWVDKAVPCNLGDYYQGFRVVGTTPDMFGSLEFSPGQKYGFAAGENFAQEDYFTAVIGATVAEQTGLRVGDEFKPSHAADDGHVHEEQFTITGILDRTGTPIDRALYVNIEGFFLLRGHALEGDPTQPGGGGHKHDDKQEQAKEAEHDDNHAHELDKGANTAETTKDHEHDHTQPAKVNTVPAGDNEHAHEPAVAAAVETVQEESPEHGHDHAAPSAPHDHETESEHADGHKHDHAHGDHDHDHAHHHDEPLPEAQREVTAILILTKSISGLPPEATVGSIYKSINKDVVAQAVQPIRVIYEFLTTFLRPLQLVLLGLTVLIVIVSAISILVSIYNSMSERRHEIAVMRALGAGRSTVMQIMLLESVLLALGGGLAGWLVGHAILGALTPWLTAWTGVTFTAFHFTGTELLLIPGIIALASLVGFLPAWSAYRTDVAKALTANP